VSRWDQCFPDPGITIGRFRVLPRTDGRWIVYDPERPFARRTVEVGTTRDAAILLARRLNTQPSPNVTR
jgi:hypothetical protein